MFPPEDARVGVGTKKILGSPRAVDGNPELDQLKGRSTRGAIAGVGPLDAIAAAMGHVEECDP